MIFERVHFLNFKILIRLIIKIKKKNSKEKKDGGGGKKERAFSNSGKYSKMDLYSSKKLVRDD